MTFDEFKAQTLAHVEAERAMIRNPKGDVHPAVIFGGQGGELVPLSVPRGWFGSRQRKDRLASLVATAVTRGRPEFVATVQTAMFTRVNAADLTEEQLRQIANSQVPDGMLPPLEDPNALEMLQVVIFSATTTVAFDSEITRSDGPPAYAPWQEMDRPSGLLVEPIQAAMRRAA
jgi:hypothetical protein